MRLRTDPCDVALGKILSVELYARDREKMVCRYLGFEPFFGVLSQDIGSVALTPHSIPVDVECGCGALRASVRMSPLSPWWVA